MLAKFTGKVGLITFIAVAALTIFASALNAETEDKEDCVRHNFDSYFRYMPSRKVDSQSGKIGIMEADSEYSYEFKAFDKLPVKFSLDNKYIGIENTTGVELPAHLVGLTGDIETTLPFFNLDKTYLRLGVSPSFYGEDWDFETSQFRIPSRYFLIHSPNDRWTFIAGIAVYPDFEREVWPILGFIYKANDKLTFNIVPKRPTISYILNDRITLFAEGGASFNSEFEVTKDNLKNVVLRYQERHLGAGIKYKVNKFIQSSISAGGAFNRSLKYRDSLGKVEIKDGAYAEFRLEIRI
jgi:hypothetical protein